MRNPVRVRASTSKVSMKDKPLYAVPGRANSLDRRLPTDQLKALRINLARMERQLSKAIDPVKRKLLAAKIEACKGNIQRVASLVTKQWERDQATLDTQRADRVGFHWTRED